MEPKHLSTSIKGETLSLEKYTPEFSDVIFRIVESDRNRMKPFLPWVNGIKSVEDVEKYIDSRIKAWEEATSFFYGIIDTDTGNLVGTIDVPRIDWYCDRCDLGFWIADSHEGKGFIRTAVSLLESHLYESGFNRIEILCSIDNVRSHKVAESCNYQLEGTLRQWFKVGDNYQDLHLYAKLRDDWGG